MNFNWIHISDLAIVDAWALTWINLSNYYIISLMYLWAEGLPHWILWAYASVTHVLSLSLMCGTLNIILLRTILIFRSVHVDFISILSKSYQAQTFWWNFAKIQVWYFVTKIVLTYCENSFLQILGLQPRISKVFLTRTIYSNSERSVFGIKMFF